MREENRKESTSGVPIPQFMLSKTPLKKPGSMVEQIRRHSLITARDDQFFKSKDESEHLLGEGLNFPHGYPVSKAEEKALKKVRRRIKNKLSAQESRRRKKEYIEGLEKRVRLKEKETAEMKLKVEKTEERLRSMVDELFLLKQHQAVPETKMVDDKKETSSPKEKPITITSISRATQTGVCLQCYIGQWQATTQNSSNRLQQESYSPLVKMEETEQNLPKPIIIQDDSEYVEDCPSLSSDGSTKSHDSSLDETSPSLDNNDGLLYMQLMRTGDTSPKYDASILSPA